MKTSYCKLCDREVEEQVFDCYKCEMTICPECIGKAKETCMGMLDFLCPECGEIVYIRLLLPLTRLPPDVQEKIGQKNRPEHSMGVVHSPASKDARFHPNRRRRHGVKRRQATKENQDDLDADLRRARLRDREPNT
jgi:hypothetical protein